MEFTHLNHPRHFVRLGYGMNVHPADDLEGVLEGLRRITLPLRERLAAGRPFGLGLYLAAGAVRELAESPSRRGALAGFLAEHALDAFTYNAFPYQRFQADGLKAAVFDPPWSAVERAAYTSAIAEFAVEFARDSSRERHLSISTHTGGHSTRWRRDEELERGAQALFDTARGLAELERRSERRVVLALEPEPRANCNDLAELVEWRARIVGLAANATERALLDRHLGTCLDACHAAVEFEPPEEAFELATANGAPLGKLQFTSALALVAPTQNASARERFLALDEPRFLHQVTARGPRGFARAGDLPEVRAAWDRGDWSWRRSDEWRCHFHVPVDLASGGLTGLTTTRDEADRILDAALAHPERWGTSELQVEIETYTWDVLPSDARGEGAVLDGLEREYRHVIGRLAARGWAPA